LCARASVGGTVSRRRARAKNAGESEVESDRH
jgi:hypothetical protein